MNWVKTEYGFRLVVSIATYEQQSDAHYDICVARRPHYCDRGNWLIHVEGRNDLDGSDGFPRYFLGSEEDVKRQMEMWLAGRAAYQKYIATKEVL